MTTPSLAITNVASALLAQSLGNDPSAKYILIGLVGVVVLYVIVRPFMQKKKKRDPLERTSPIGSLSQHRGVERQMQNLLVELNEMARQMSAQLDTRSTKLELLIKDADDRLAELKRMTALAASTTPRFEIRDTPLRDAPMREGGLRDAVSYDAPARDESSFRQPPSRRYESATDPETQDAAHLPVYQLSDAGNSVSDIAATLGRPSGEIELILALRPKATRI